MASTQESSHRLLLRRRQINPAPAPIPLTPMLPSPASSTNSSPPRPSPAPRRPLRPDFSPVIYFDQPPPSDPLRAASDFGFFHLAATASPPLSSNRTAEGCGAGNADEGDEDDGRRFHAFYLEEYAWRIHHEHLPLKDPLVEIPDLASS
ncbi:hypothetical protein BHE74_00004184 [Ensete ventricosum]|nr:hypothetical protein BHE74_00004184 [Ensete ventricosum]